MCFTEESKALGPELVPLSLQKGHSWFCQSVFACKNIQKLKALGTECVGPAGEPADSEAREPVSSSVGAPRTTAEPAALH